MNCYKCKAPLPETAKFCGSCGSLQTSPNVQTSQPASIKVFNNKSKFVTLGVITLLIVAFWQVNIFLKKSNRSDSLRELGSLCKPVDIYGAKVSYGDTKLTINSKITADDVCQASEEYATMSRKESDGALENMCHAVDEASIKELGHGNYAAGKERIEFLANSGDQGFKKINKLLKACESTSSRSKFLESPNDNISRVIYSVGSFSLEGKSCKGYLVETAGVLGGSKLVGYDFYGMGSCSDMRFAKNVFHPENNPSAPLAGDYYKSIRYDGALPETWLYKGTQYYFSSPPAPAVLKPTPAPVEPAVEEPAPKVTEESVNTVAGKLVIQSKDYKNTILLNGKVIETCDENESFCGADIVRIHKTFNMPDKTVILVAAGLSGSCCPETYYTFLTINKNGSHQVSKVTDTLQYIDDKSIAQSGSKVVLTFPTDLQNMTGTEVWTYENGQVTGPIKTVKPKFNVNLDTIQKITIGDDIHNHISGVIVKEGQDYYLKPNSPVMIVDKPEEKYPALHSGDIVDKLEILLASNDSPTIPPLGKGTFDISLLCARDGCSIDRFEKANALIASNITISTKFQGTWADADGCAKFKSNGEFDPGAVITSDHINRYEHNCALAKVIATSTNSFSGEFTCFQEGETTKETISLTFQLDGKLAGISNNPLPMCK